MKNTVKKLYSFFFLLLILFIYCITQKQPRNTHKQKFNGSLCHVLGKVEMHLEILSNNWKNPTTDSFSQSQGKKKPVNVSPIQASSGGTSIALNSQDQQGQHQKRLHWQPSIYLFI